jgi:hypothetical protein
MIEAGRIPHSFSIVILSEAKNPVALRKTQPMAQFVMLEKDSSLHSE